MSLPKQRMARTMQPDDFFDEALMSAEREHQLPVRIIYLALHTMADREGRFVWDAKTMRYLSLDEPTVVSRTLDVLHQINKVTRYTVADQDYGVIHDFTRKQHINPREKQSSLPALKGSKIALANTKPVVKAPVAVKADAIVVNQEKDHGVEELSTANPDLASALGMNLKDESTEVAKEPDLKATTFDVERHGFIYKRRPNLGIYRYTQNKADFPVLVADVDDVSPVIAVAMLTKSDIPELGISEGRAKVYDDLYPHGDNVARVKSAVMWLMDNPAKRKTAGGISSFLGKWVESAQNKNQQLLPQNGLTASQQPRMGGGLGFKSRINPDERTQEVGAQMRQMFAASGGYATNEEKEVFEARP